MITRLLAAAALAIAFMPGIANAEHVARAPQPVERYQRTTDPVTGFLTWLVVPSATHERSIPYADNPDLIGNRYGATDPAWRK